MKWKMNFTLIIILSIIDLAVAQQASEKLTLAECIQLAWKNNPSLQQSGISVEQAHLSTRQSYSNLFPSVGVSAGTSSSNNNLPGSDWQSQWSVQGSVDQSLYRPGMYSFVQLSKVNERISQISNEDLKSQIRLAVENYYFQILTSYALISVYEDNIRLAAENLEKIRTMYKLGAKTESDVLKAEVQKGDFEAMLLSELERLQNYKRSLNITMGRSPNIEFEVEYIAAQDVDIPELEMAKKLLLENNREYQALKQSFKSQEIALRIAREAYLPSLSGYYSHSRSGRWANNDPLVSNQVGLRASLDLFTGFNKSLNVQKERLNLEKAKIDLEAKERELMAQLTNLYTSLQTYNNLIKIDEKNVESSKRDLELVTARYAVGASTILDQMNAQASLLQSQSSLVKDKYSRKIIESQIKQLLAQL
ncbi:MAG: TolC family protein [candidate division KSB1 bacterium]|nr:TolC family protein [candidate division KSB1 bacterium]MDZ7357251.1 TolC family protein [candidate division KSB1 bacterium]MDZ7402121.1 TolC family protein [candidate division KSB1 bacterium]